MVAQRFSAGKSAKKKAKPRRALPIRRRCRGMRVQGIAPLPRKRSTCAAFCHPLCYVPRSLTQTTPTTFNSFADGTYSSPLKRY